MNATAAMLRAELEYFKRKHVAGTAKADGRASARALEYVYGTGTLVDRPQQILDVADGAVALGEGDIDRARRVGLPAAKAWAVQAAVAIAVVRTTAPASDRLMPRLSDAEMELAMQNRDLGPLVQANARGVVVAGPTQGGAQSAIWYHDNLRVQGAGPQQQVVQLRTHSANPNAPQGTFSQSNYTTQIHMNNGRYLLPDGTWKTIAEMTPAERAAAHIPAGN